MGATLCLTDGSGRWQNFWLACYELVTMDYVYGLMTHLVESIGGVRRSA